NTLQPPRGLARAVPRRPKRRRAAAIEAVDRHDVRAVVETFERGRDCSNARGKGESCATAFEIGDAALKCHACRVLGAGVVVALVHAGTLQDVGGGGVDRHHDGAGCRVGFLPGVDAARGEVELVFLRHSSLTFRRHHPCKRMIQQSHASNFWMIMHIRTLDDYWMPACAGMTASRLKL